MVRVDDARRAVRDRQRCVVRVHDALDDDGKAGALGQPRQIAPVERRIEERDHVMREAGVGMGFADLIESGRHQVRHLETVRKVKAVPHVPLPRRPDLRIHGEDDRRASRRLGTLDEAARSLPIPVDV